MAGPTTIQDGGLIVKDPSDISVYTFDWDTEHLAPTVTIVSSAFTITALSPVGDTALTKDQESTLVSLRSTQLRLTGGTLGARYEIANRIVTSETPAQTKERSCYILIEDK